MEGKCTWPQSPDIITVRFAATCLVKTLIPDFTRIKTFPPSQTVQSIPLPMIRESVGEKEGVEPTPHRPPAPDNTAESNDFQRTGSLTVASVGRNTLVETTGLEREVSSAEIETNRDSKQAHPVILGRAADDEKETAVPTWPSPPLRPRAPINTYINTQSMQGSQVVRAKEVVQAHSLTITGVDKSKKEDGVFVNIPLDLGEIKKEGGQETGGKDHDKERWRFACGFELLERWWKRMFAFDSR
ncbi:hypothetical protein BGX38DRAFT_1161703 [Terfezia claveryi]|nr:hypothetical protein BGX38DRAFT_1161703 [Terfezia claveryi]